MSDVVSRGIYKCIKNGLLYNVIKIGRSVDNPNKQCVIYEQLYASKLRGTDTDLSIGSVWIRDLDEFHNKFVKQKN